MVALAQRLLEETNAHVVHVAGRDEAADVAARIAAATGSSDRYRVVDYIDEMGDAIAAADLIVARAGATSLAEITAIGRASLLVPYPYATDDHQTGNARALSEAGGAIIVADNELDSAHFADSVIELLRDSDRRAHMAHAARGLGRPDAAEQVAAIALAVARSRKESR
jgi:UDP-N-acetylglucosamine--N-acetylmuramyl-(pentapeptide) pyrophosphoryl-undecaprenol N-acetylglucosamine transferase